MSKPNNLPKHVKAAMNVGVSCGMILSIDNDFKNDDINLGTVFRAFGGAMVGGFLMGGLADFIGESSGYAISAITIGFTGLKLLDIKRRR